MGAWKSKDTEQTLTLNEDKTFTCTYGDTEVKGTWTVDDAFVVLTSEDGQIVRLSIDVDPATLTYTNEDGTAYIFELEKAEEAPAEAA